ncbi:hypothetical protein ACROYT_G022197 [Oculina patagonica]
MEIYPPDWCYFWIYICVKEEKTLEMRRLCCIKMATMKKQEKKCKSIKHVLFSVHKEKVDKHSSTAEMQIAWTMLSSRKQ